MIKFTRTDGNFERGNMIVGVLIFIFVMIGYVGLCFRGTLQEAKLSAMFIQETQSCYALENTLHIGRDYIRNLICNPYMPNILFSPSSLRKYTTSGLINTNSFFNKSHIVPDNYPLVISSATIDGGPIFFVEKNRDSNDKRHLAEFFLRANLSISSPFIPNWVARSAQLVELERNPLSDFQIFADGDASILTQYHCLFNGKVHINGNLRFGSTSGMANFFYAKTGVAGHIMRIRTSPYASLKLPNEDVANGRGGVALTGIALEPGRSGDASYNSSDAYSPDRSTSGNVQFMNNSGSIVSYNLGDYSSNILGKSFENQAFERWKLGLTTRHYQLRPLGFDSTMYDGYWHNGIESGAQKNHKFLELACGPYSLINAKNKGAAKLWGTNQSNTVTAFSELRGLSSQQALEKLKLVESQKMANQPGFIVKLYASEKKSFAFKEAFPYSPSWPHLFDITAAGDKYAIWSYENIIKSNKCVVDGILTHFQVTTNTFLTSSDVNVETESLQCFRLNVSSQNKLLFQVLNEQPNETVMQTNGLAYPSWRSIISTQTPATTNSTPDSMFSYITGTWSVAYNYASGIKQISHGNNFKFIYDKNRRKWIQIIDFDVAALLSKIAAGTISLSNLAGHVHFCLHSGEWLGSENFYNKLETNHKEYDSDTTDIRNNYFAKRRDFFDVVENAAGSFNNQNTPPIGIGIRIINAQKLPTGGLTISSIFPIYVQGDFNTVDEQKCSGIYADSVTILSKSWKDSESALSADSLLKTPVSEDVTINANIISGSTNPVYWTKEQGNISRIPEAGIFNSLKVLENFSPYVVKIKGSILTPYKSKIQWEPFVVVQSSSVGSISYAEHIIRPDITPFTYSSSSKVNSFGVSPCMPYYMVVNKGRKTHMIGESTYNTLTSIINIDWDSSTNTFNTYTNSLPNYLK